MDGSLTTFLPPQTPVTSNFNTFSFVDIFSGIGGMRIAAEMHGGRCLFSSEIDGDAAATYQANHGDKPDGDITLIPPKSLPDHDILFGGFPCQPFSICGLQRRFFDTRGTLFFHVLEIARQKRPKCILLENVANLAKHDGGKTIAVISESLQELGYTVSIAVLDAKDFGVPQSRKRTIIVASVNGTMDFRELPRSPPVSIADVLEVGATYQFLQAPYTLVAREGSEGKPSGLMFAGYRNSNLRKADVRPGTAHLSRAHKQHSRIYSSAGTHPTLAAGETSGRYWILHEGMVRKLTIRECYRMQGFPDDFRINQSKTAAYRQIGNSVPVPMIATVLHQILTQGLLRPRSPVQAGENNAW